MEQLTISPKAEDAFQRLQDTKLEPMEEALFRSWTKANQIADPDAPGDVVDYRGIYRATKGQVLPHGQLKQMAQQQNDENTLEKALQERMAKRVTELTGKEDDMARDKFKAERQDVTHKQKLEQGKQKMEHGALKLKEGEQKLKHAPFDVERGKIDLEKQKLGIEAQVQGHKDKKLDLISQMMNPAGTGPSESRGSGNESNTAGRN
jgi:hypothetical protein